MTDFIDETFRVGKTIAAIASDLRQFARASKRVGNLSAAEEMWDKAIALEEARDRLSEAVGRKSRNDLKSSEEMLGLTVAAAISMCVREEPAISAKGDEILESIAPKGDPS